MRNPDVFLSLGSNLGERRKNIKKALDKLSGHGIIIESVSSFYETEPVGDTAQPPYVNIVCRTATSLPPLDLLALCQDIEKKLGRKKKGDGSSRCIDIDILSYGDREISTSRLTIPHHELHNRNFVLIPMKEIYPDFINPVTGEHIDEIIENCRDGSWIEIMK